MKTPIRVLGLAAASLLTLSACGGGGGASSVDASCEPTIEVETVNEGELSVALTNTPPYSMEENGEMAGIDSDILEQFAAEACLELTYAPYTYATAVPATEQGRVDVAVGGFYRTEARGEVVRLSTPVYLDELTVMSTDGSATVDDLEGKRIGTVEGYLWVDDLKALPNVETRVYPDSLSLANELKAGRLDAGLDGYGAAMISAEGTEFELEVLQSDERVSSTNQPSQTAILINPENEALGEALDAFIEELRENGELVKILEDNGLPASAAEVGDARLI
ncbi:amino acid ABC transporter substrate-binding protein [Aeromicrobium phragmitis]|uniref:Amino acid ABC transporter substrate-binding protein n=1 Tax=Aeromicrobium phragmitis TaxID=2478914 RepID=A0A3L8PRH0_9ACTN|nr:ABC transporter substrate-binding protein [Aeromicrobium phragmitis]RLV57489.1 amino acid ABC transporter substrate-binding protein [Aeromicrobium phragmitis]